MNIELVNLTLKVFEVNKEKRSVNLAGMRRLAAFAEARRRLYGWCAARRETATPACWAGTQTPSSGTEEAGGGGEKKKTT